MIGEGDLTRIEHEVKAIVDGSVESAKQSPLPQPEDLYSDIYAGGYADVQRRDPWR